MVKARSTIRSVRSARRGCERRSGPRFGRLLALVWGGRRAPRIEWWLRMPGPSPPSVESRGFSCRYSATVCDALTTAFCYVTCSLSVVVIIPPSKVGTRVRIPERAFCSTF